MMLDYALNLADQALASDHRSTRLAGRVLLRALDDLADGLNQGFLRIDGDTRAVLRAYAGDQAKRDRWVPTLCLRRQGEASGLNARPHLTAQRQLGVDGGAEVPDTVVGAGVDGLSQTGGGIRSPSPVASTIASSLVSPVRSNTLGLSAGDHDQGHRGHSDHGSQDNGSQTLHT
jgi:hypothetical protein